MKIIGLYLKKIQKPKNLNNTEGYEEKVGTSGPLPSSTPVPSLRRNHGGSSGILPEILYLCANIYSPALKNTA